MLSAATAPSVLVDTIKKTIVGQTSVVESLLLAVIAGGHILLEGPPGLAKTLSCRALAAGIGGRFKRIQFTPDLLPSDVVGTRIFDQKTGEFSVALGPIFANIVLADEINRAPAKVQSALLEAMQEHQVTIGPETFQLPNPFVVMATMNPLDSDGTYALPLAQMDRFLMNVVVDYPSPSEELLILDRFAGGEPDLPPDAVDMDDVLTWRKQARTIFLDDKIKSYIVNLIAATREPHRYLDRGASPRATIALASLARARAYIEGRSFVVPDDVRSLAALVLRHRLAFNYRAVTDHVAVADIVEQLISSVPVP
jgi:MoxR-like ATPase